MTKTYRQKSTGQIIALNLVDDYEEVEQEPSYTILSFLNHDVEVYLHEDGYYSWSNNTDEHVTLQDMLVLKKAIINKVKRNNDNQIFILGDSVDYAGDIKTISKFYISGEEMCYEVDGISPGLFLCNAKHRTKVPKVIFITNGDNVDIVENQKYYFCYEFNNKWIFACSIASIHHISFSKNVYFSTEQGVINYCKQKNSFLYITEDGVPVYYMGENYSVNLTTYKITHRTGIIALADNHSNYKFFSTREKAEEYIRNNYFLFTTSDNKKIHKGERYWFCWKDCTSKKYWSELGSEFGIRHEQYITFSTEELASDYLLMNVPILSLNDVISENNKPFSNVKFIENCKNLVKSRL